MIKNTLREANKALVYYNKEEGLKLNWAMPTEYSEEYFRNLFQNVMLDTATTDLIGIYIYEDKANALADLKEDVNIYSNKGGRKKALIEFLKLIDTYGGQEDFEKTLKNSFDKQYEWRKPRRRRNASLKLDWANVPDIDEEIRVGDEVGIWDGIKIGKVIEIGNFYDVKEYDTGIVQELIDDGIAKPDTIYAAIFLDETGFQSTAVYELHGLIKYTPSLKLD